MIGILTVTHNDLGHAIIKTTELILTERIEYIHSVSIDLKESASKLRDKILSGIKKVDNGEGVIVLTDMFGGAPSNLSYSFLEEGRVEVISGVNLPMMMRAIKERRGNTLPNFASDLETFGKKSISLASSILRGNKR